MRRIVEGGAGFFHHYPRMATVVTCHVNGFDNALAVAWHTPLSRRPMLFGVSISPLRHSHELIMAAGEFAVNFLPLEKAAVIATIGGTSGRQGDKFRRFNIAKEAAQKIAAPILADAYAAYECLLHSQVTLGDHELFVGEVVATHVEDDFFGEVGAPDLAKVHPALFLPGELYGTVDGASLRSVPRADDHIARLRRELEPPTTGGEA